MNENPRYSLRDVSRAILQSVEDRYGPQQLYAFGRDQFRRERYVSGVVRSAKDATKKEWQELWEEPTRGHNKLSMYNREQIEGVFDALKDAAGVVNELLGQSQENTQKTNRLRRALVEPAAVLYQAECLVFGINEPNPHDEK
jgi:hypothetical protein